MTVAEWRQFQPCAQWHYAGDHRSDGLSGDVGELSVNATPHQLPLWSTLLSYLRRHSLYQRWQCQWNSSLLLLGLSTCASGGAYRTIASCGLRRSAPAVCVAPAPVLEFSLFVCGERSSWRQLRSRVVVSCVLARCLSASATQQGKFEELSMMEHFLRASAATPVAAAETLRRHTLRLLLRQQRRCGVTLSVVASHSHTAVAAAEMLRRHSGKLLLRQQGRLPVVITSHQLLRRSQRRACDEALLPAPAVSENSAAWLERLSSWRREDVCQMVALARCSSLLDEITKRCPLRGDERPDMRRRGAHFMSSCSDRSTCARVVEFTAPAPAAIAAHAPWVSTLFLLLQWQLLRPTCWYTWTDR